MYQSEPQIPERPLYRQGDQSLFWLAFGTGLLTILTLGLYRFWMTTRLRRHYWSSIHIMGDPLEYTGKGLEKFLGFLLAIVILAVYLSVVNLGLAFLGLVQFDDPVALQVALNLSVLTTLPLIYFALYRARRYILSRTRWRGIRFGMENGAWGYTGRALLMSLLTAVTLGLMYPYQHFHLTKYKTDRMWFGTQRFHQHGRWQGLFGYWAWVYLMVVFLIGGVIAVALAAENPIAGAIGGVLLMVGYIGIFLLGLRYRVCAFRYFWSHRTLGEARFTNDIDIGEVFGITIGGSMAVGACATILGGLVGAIFAGIWVGVIGLDNLQAMIDQAQEGGPADPTAAWPLLGALALVYLSMFVFGMAFSQIFLTRPILKRQAQGMIILNAPALADSEQRAYDQALEAGGFADALGVDVGAGF